MLQAMHTTFPFAQQCGLTTLRAGSQSRARDASTRKAYIIVLDPLFLTFPSEHQPFRVPSWSFDVPRHLSTRSIRPLLLLNDNHSVHSHVRNRSRHRSAISCDAVWSQACPAPSVIMQGGEKHGPH